MFQILYHQLATSHIANYLSLWVTIVYNSSHEPLDAQSALYWISSRKNCTTIKLTSCRLILHWPGVILLRHMILLHQYFVSWNQVSHIGTHCCFIQIVSNLEKHEDVVVFDMLSKELRDLTAKSIIRKEPWMEQLSDKECKFRDRFHENLNIEGWILVPWS